MDIIGQEGRLVYAFGFAVMFVGLALSAAYSVPLGLAAIIGGWLAASYPLYQTIKGALHALKGNAYGVPLIVGIVLGMSFHVLLLIVFAYGVLIGL